MLSADIQIIWDPEVIRYEYPDLTEGQFQFLQAITTLKNSNEPFNDFYIFENVITALNYKIPNFRILEPPTAEELWHGIKMIRKIVPNIPFSFEVNIYVKKILNDNGIYFYPKEIESDTKILNKIIEKSTMGPFPLKDNNILDIQASHYLVLEAYHQSQLNIDFSWTNQ